LSGIPGCFRRDGAPADPGLLQAMFRAAPHRGPDGNRSWIDGPAALGYQQLCVSAEDPQGTQPLDDAAHGLSVVFDGRLDNREHLQRRLGALLTGHSDAALVLAAYLEWGERSPAYLLGDFVFVVWDARRGAIFCARDVMGVKPFYYAVDAHRFVWGSELAQVLAGGVPCEPNEGMIAELLAHNPTSHTDTLYRDVFRLPAAHSLTVTPDRVRMERYWQFDLTKTLRYRRDEEYGAHLASLFDEAVRCRLRVSVPIGSYLSGGLDSSSVVGTACALGAGIETFSLVYPFTPSADESRYIDDVVAHWQLHAHKVAVGPVDGTRCRELVRRRADVMDLPADHEGECLSVAMRDRSMRVVLTGMGGDYAFGGSFFHYADLLRAGDLVGLARQLRADAHHPDIGWSPSALFACGVRPLIPRSWRKRVRPLARRLGWMPPPPAWVDPRLAARVSLEDRLRSTEMDGGAVESAFLLEQLQHGWTYRILETAERAAAEYGIEERHPFFDRRVMEFALAIPDTQRWQGVRTKYVLRQAMQQRLPVSVYDRLDKGDFSPVVPRAVEAIGGAGLFDALRIADLGWVNQSTISEMYRTGRKFYQADDERYCPLMFRLWMVAGVELWYRAKFLDEAIDERSESIRSRQQHGREAAAAAALPEPLAH
jgi:asparagine synthase (glutamine-hydrolysing)